MKKFLYLFFGLFLLTGFSIAQETTMPSDEEILETIKQFHFDKDREEYLFKETKKNLTKLYEEGCFEPDVIKTDKNIQGIEPSVENPNKGR